MEFDELLPEILPLIPTLGSAAIGAVGLFLNRRSRAMSELDKLLDMR